MNMNKDTVIPPHALVRGAPTSLEPTDKGFLGDLTRDRSLACIWHYDGIVGQLSRRARCRVRARSVPAGVRCDDRGRAARASEEAAAPVDVRPNRVC